MKLILAIIGLALVLVIIAGAVLYILNEKGILKGPLSDWITKVKNSILGIKDDTEEMIDQMKNSEIVPGRGSIVLFAAEWNLL